MEWQRERDEDENAVLEVPSDEEVSWPAIWIADLYDPSHLKSLVEGLDRLGFGEGADRRFGGKDGVTWVRSQRQRFFASGTWTSGFLAASDTAFAPLWRRADLPDSIAWARLTLWAVGPSAIVGVWTLRLDKSATAQLETALRSRAQTELEPLDGGGYAVLDVADVRRQQLDAARGELLSRCASWHKKSMAGVIADADAWPVSAELIVTKLADPLVPGDLEPGQPGWLSILGSSWGRTLWASTEIPGLRLRFPDPESSRPTLTLGGRKADLLKARPGTEDEHSLEWLAQNRGRYIALLLSRWALSLAFDHYGARLASIGGPGDTRDMAAREATRHLDAVSSDLLPLAADVDSTATDVKQLCQDPDRYGWSVPEFVAMPPEPPGSDDSDAMSRRDVKLLDSMRVALEATVAEATRRTQRVRDGLLASTNVLQAAADLKLQVRLSLVAGLAIVVSLVSLSVQVLDDDEPAPRTVVVELPAGTARAGEAAATTLIAGARDLARERLR